MADYPVLPDPEPADSTLALTWALITAALNSLPQIALPPKRLELERPARDLARKLKENAR